MIVLSVYYDAEWGTYNIFVTVSLHMEGYEQPQVVYIRLVYGGHTAGAQPRQAG